MGTYRSLLYFGATMAATYVASAYLTEGDARDDQLALVWLVCLALALAVYVAIDGASRARRREEEAREHDALVDGALKVLLRQKLVSEHDRLVALGDADDTQRRAWVASYEVYESLCDATGDHNGVVDSYKEDVLALPPWDGRARAGAGE